MCTAQRRGDCLHCTFAQPSHSLVSCNQQHSLTCCSDGRCNPLAVLSEGRVWPAWLLRLQLHEGLVDAGLLHDRHLTKAAHIIIEWEDSDHQSSECQQARPCAVVQ
jgi:hypothetical protein